MWRFLEQERTYKPLNAGSTDKGISPSARLAQFLVCARASAVSLCKSAKAALHEFLRFLRVGRPALIRSWLKVGVIARIVESFAGIHSHLSGLLFKELKLSYHNGYI